MQSSPLLLRNVAAVEQKLREVDYSLAKQQACIDGLHATVATLASQVQQLQSLLLILRAEKQGHGPSVKG